VAGIEPAAFSVQARVSTPDLHPDNISYEQVQSSCGHEEPGGQPQGLGIEEPQADLVNSTTVPSTVRTGAV